MKTFNLRSTLNPSILQNAISSNTSVATLPQKPNNRLGNGEYTLAFETYGDLRAARLRVEHLMRKNNLYHFALAEACTF